MCGIAGHIGPRLLEDARARACAALTRRRGPDAEGRSRHVTLDGRHVLLHSRLAILDFTGGRPLSRVLGRAVDDFAPEGLEGSFSPAAVHHLRENTIRSAITTIHGSNSFEPNLMKIHRVLVA